ncbi:MAG: CopG family ribbon-helix-helix protein [Aestuariivirga sp.]
MSTTPFSIRIDSDVKTRLEREAEREDRSAGYIAQKAIEDYLDGREYFRKEMEVAIAEADKGVFISEEAMDAWVNSWDTENELPPPKPDVFPVKADS